MSKGFLVIAENNNNIDFVQMAYVLARSLHKSQTSVKKLSIIVTDISTVKEEYKEHFDKIIVQEDDKEWNEKSKSIDTTSLCASYYDLTPYDETIVLDTDMIFPVDISDWWNLLSDKELIFTTNVRAFRGEVITRDYYRKVYTQNNLPNIYTGLFYFKKTSTTKEFFELVNTIFNNWEDYFKVLEEEFRPTFLSADVAYAIAYKLLELPDYSVFPLPTFTHMKTQLQGTDLVQEEWTKILNVDIDDEFNLKINNFTQKFPFHYHDKNFITKDLIEIYTK